MWDQCGSQCVNLNESFTWNFLGRFKAALFELCAEWKEARNAVRLTAITKDIPCFESFFISQICVPGLET
jgi:hypothetical protein